MNGRTGSAAFWGGLAIVLVLVAVFVAGGSNQEPLDPRSTSDDGAKGLVDVVREFGGEVTLGVALPTAEDDVALLLADTYGRDDREAVEAWVRSGGRLFVADPRSPLTPRLAEDGPREAVGPCGVDALAAVRTIVGSTNRYRAPADGDLCADGAVAVDPLGDGVIVSLGMPDPLLNENFDAADNSVLAVSVLVPSVGTRLVVLEPRLPVGDAGEDLMDLIPRSLWVFLVQLGVGFLIIAWWQSRRLGAPVAEPELVAIEGSELAAARGRLLEGMRLPAAAAAELRADTRRQLVRRLGLAHDAPLDLLAQRVAHLAGVSEQEVMALLETRPISSDADLADLGQGLARLRRAASQPRPPVAGASTTASVEGAQQ